jgi:hypothetical protein
MNTHARSICQKSAGRRLQQGRGQRAAESSRGRNLQSGAHPHGDCEPLNNLIRARAYDVQSCGAVERV